MLVTSQPPATVTADSGFDFTVTAEDAQGNTVSSFAGSETVALANGPTGGTLGGTLTVNAMSGVATFAGLTLNKAGGGYTLAVTSAVLASAASSSISVAPGTATQLLITRQPPATVIAGSGFGLTVTAEDAEGNVATDFTGNETVTLASNPGGSTLGGTVTVAAAGGVASLSGLTLDKAGSGYTLQITSGLGAVSAATTNGFDVTTLSQSIAFGALANQAYGNAPFVVSASATSGLPVSFTIESGPATIDSATNTVTITGAGTVIVEATQAGNVTYNPTAPVDQSFVVSKAPLTVTANSTSRLDSAADPVFTATISGFVNGETLSTSGVTGIASLTSNDTALSPVGNYTITAALGTLSATNYDFATFASGTLAVTAGAATHLLIISQPPATVTAGSGFRFTVAAEDVEGNVATDFSGDITVVLANNPSASTLGGTLTVGATDGVAVFAGLILNKVGMGYTLSTTSTGLTTAATNGFDVVPGAATQLFVMVQPPASVTAGGAFGLTVAAEDAQGNVATNLSGNLTVAVGNDPGGGTLMPAHFRFRSTRELPAYRACRSTRLTQAIHCKSVVAGLA